MVLLSSSPGTTLSITHSWLPACGQQPSNSMQSHGQLNTCNTRRMQFACSESRTLPMLTVTSVSSLFPQSAGQLKSLLCFCRNRKRITSCGLEEVRAGLPNSGHRRGKGKQNCLIKSQSLHEKAEPPQPQSGSFCLTLHSTAGATDSPNRLVTVCSEHHNTNQQLVALAA